MFVHVLGPILARLTGWVFPKIIVALQILTGPNRSTDQVAATIRADIANKFIDARFTVGAFETTDHDLRRIWWQVFVAVFAVWPDFQSHLSISFLRAANEK